MKEPIHTIVETMLDEIDSVQLTDNTWQEARNARDEIQSIVRAYVGPLCKEAERLHRRVQQLKELLCLKAEPEPVIEVDDTVITYASTWPAEMEDS